MLIGVTGYKGNVGRRLLKKYGRDCVPLECDVRDSTSVEKALRAEMPDVIIHAAGKSSVDWCEQNADLATRANWTGAVNVFEIAEKLNMKVILLSSDHVFSGNWLGAYKEDSEDFKPRNHYGITKYIAEAATISYDNVKVVRTSTLYWEDRCIFEKYYNLLSKHQIVKPPVFIWRSFTHIDFFVESLVKAAGMFDTLPKMLHLSGSKTVSWWRLIKSWADEQGLGEYVRPRYTDMASPTCADRPKRAGLSTEFSNTLGFKQYDYMDAIRWQQS